MSRQRDSTDLEPRAGAPLAFPPRLPSADAFCIETLLLEHASSNGSPRGKGAASWIGCLRSHPGVSSRSTQRRRAGPLSRPTGPPPRVHRHKERRRDRDLRGSQFAALQACRREAPRRHVSYRRGSRTQERLVGVRHGIPSFVTQRIEFKAAQLSLPSGVLLTRSVNGEHGLIPVLTRREHDRSLRVRDPG